MDIPTIIFEAVENSKRHRWSVAWGRSSNPDITVGEALALCHSELSEALQAYRNDDIESFGEELADTIIRICHMSGCLDIDLDWEIQKKIKINKDRAVQHNKVYL